VKTTLTQSFQPFTRFSSLDFSGT